MNPCVCVQEAERKSVGHKSDRTKPQDGSLCESTHTAVSAVLLLCCCFVAMHIASRSGGESGQSTSNLLAQSWACLA